MAIVISTGSNDPRTGEQLGALASLPSIAVTSLIALNAIPATLGLAVAAAAVLVVLNALGWRITSALFDRERLITGSASPGGPLRAALAPSLSQ